MNQTWRGLAPGSAPEFLKTLGAEKVVSWVPGYEITATDQPQPEGSEDYVGVTQSANLATLREGCHETGWMKPVRRGEFSHSTTRPGEEHDEDRAMEKRDMKR